MKQKEYITCMNNKMKLNHELLTNLLAGPFDIKRRTRPTKEERRQWFLNAELEKENKLKHDKEIQKQIRKRQKPLSYRINIILDDLATELETNHSSDEQKCLERLSFVEDTVRKIHKLINKTLSKKELSNPT